MWIFLEFLFWLSLATAQQVGNMVPEVHPKLQWTKCTSNGDCRPVDGEVVLDANYRWLHHTNKYDNCYSFNNWDQRVCNSNQNCTDVCAIEGAEYESVLGIKSANDSISQRLKTYLDFASNVGSRLHLMATKDKYQMFTLLNNEFAFDVDLSTVGCGINAALHFVAMNEDGGVSKYSNKKAGAEYGTGYCDSKCPRNLKFVGGKANMEGWMPAADDPNSGIGQYGACCPEFSLWDSNSHSFSFSSHRCRESQFKICELYDCDFYQSYSSERDRHGRLGPACDRWGCSFNPYRMGVSDFYGKGKKVDTSKKFTVVTRFEEHQVTQFFIQDGQKIDLPTPTLDGLPKVNGLSNEMCSTAPNVFGEQDWFNYNTYDPENNGWKAHNKLMQKPMVLTMSILHDYWGYNLWLDSLWPPEDEGSEKPGVYRGDCLPWEDNDPRVIEGRNPRATVVWSNIRFGPIGSTVKV